MALQLFVKLVYNGALGKQYSKTSVTAISALDDSASIQGALASIFNVRGETPLSTYGGDAA